MIFVQIAAYRDPELAPAIRDCLAKVSKHDDLMRIILTIVLIYSFLWIIGLPLLYITSNLSEKQFFVEAVVAVGIFLIALFLHRRISTK